MKIYTFNYETDCSLNNKPFSVNSSRLDTALDIFLKIIPSCADFSRLTVFNYQVNSNGKIQNRYLRCPHHYKLIDSKCVRYLPEMSQMFESQKWMDSTVRSDVSFKSLLTR